MSAILAGTLRAIASFIPVTATRIYLLYFAIDLFLLLGVIGFFRASLAAAKLLGFVGFVIMFLAVLILIARDVGIFPKTVYAGAAGAFSLGLVLFAIQVLLTRKISVWMPIAWILSTIIGPVGFFVPSLSFLFVISGLLFGLAFAAAGVATWRLSSPIHTDSHHGGCKF